MSCGVSITITWQFKEIGCRFLLIQKPKNYWDFFGILFSCVFKKKYAQEWAHQCWHKVGRYPRTKPYSGPLQLSLMADWPLFCQHYWMFKGLLGWAHSLSVHSLFCQASLATFWCHSCPSMSKAITWCVHACMCGTSVLPLGGVGPCPDMCVNELGLHWVRVISVTVLSSVKSCKKKYQWGAKCTLRVWLLSFASKINHGIFHIKAPILNAFSLTSTVLILTELIFKYAWWGLQPHSYFHFMSQECVQQYFGRSAASLGVSYPFFSLWHFLFWKLECIQTTENVVGQRFPLSLSFSLAYVS